MEEEQKIYTEQGVEAYVKYQLDHENEPFLPGAAFPFVKVSGHSGLVPKNFGARTEIVWDQDGHEQRGRRDGANRGQMSLPTSDVLLPGLDFPS